MRYFVLPSCLPILVSAASVSVPSTPPASAVSVDPSFPAIAFEFASLINFAQTSENDTSPNEYSLNLLHAIYSRTGGPPVIRVGGTSADYAKYISAQQEAVLPYPVIGNAQDNANTTYGPSFWPLTKNFASLNATWIPQLSLATNNFTQLAEEAKAIVSGVGWENIEALEIGNEANLFPSNGPQGPPTWSGPLNNTSYAQRERKFAEYVANVTGLAPSTRIFQVGDIAANVDHPSDYSVNIPGIFEAGVDADHNVISAAAHYYTISTGSLSDLLNHTNLVSRFAAQASWLEYLNAEQNGLPFVLDEANVLSGPTNATLMNSHASALWRLDFFLYTMSLGVKRVHYESVFGSNQSLWVPQASNGMPAETRAGFYAYPPAADFIGDSASTRTAELQLDGVDRDYFTAYAAYDGDCIGRLALLNLQEWSRGQGARPNVTVAVSGVKGTNATIRYLNNVDGVAGGPANITYAGSQWTAESSGKQVAVVDDTLHVAVSDGKVTVVVPASSAAIVSFT